MRPREPWYVKAAGILLVSAMWAGIGLWFY
jgi:hypothetical protein